MNLFRCIKGPTLFRKFRTADQPGSNYQPNLVEIGSDKIISVIRFCMSFTFWTSPVVATILYRRGYCSVDGAVSISKFLLSIGIIYGFAYITRGIGRWSNADYVAFISVLTAAQRSWTMQNKRLLAQYDFNFRAWPVDFRWSDVNKGGVKRTKIQVAERDLGDSSMLQMPWKILSYMAAHTFGRRMLYPGTTAIIGMLVQPVLLQNRAKLIEEKGGQRAKLQTEEKNEIDTLFIDRRSTIGPNGKTLVICCEGNSGFYEIGCTVTPLEAGYSVLGWNHPGFAGSSGVPFPSQEQTAIDSVMQYAINSLGFSPDNIIVFAWSIGGYTATWLAMNYPAIKYLVLDATFDDLVPLAISKMPQSLKGLVSYSIRRYLNLNISEQLCKFQGPVLLIRRTQDEIITTEVDMGGVKLYSNRGNNLLIDLLKFRYPNIVDDTTTGLLENWLSRLKPEQEVLWRELGVQEDTQLSLIRSYNSEYSDSFPSHIGENYSQEEKNRMTLYLASHYMEDFHSTHCNPLPASLLHKPWTASSDSQSRFC